MGTIVTYNSSSSDPFKRNTAFLPTAGKYMTGDITITDTGMDADDCVYQDKDGFIVLNDSYGTYVDKEILEITENGTYTAPERKTWNKLAVKVPGSELFKSIVDRTVTEIKAEDLEGVSSLCPYAFAKCTDLTSVNMPNALSIGANAFLDCTSLTTINISKATALGDRAFQGCSGLSGAFHSSTLTSIGQYCFNGARYTTLVIEKPFGGSNFNLCYGAYFQTLDINRSNSQTVFSNYSFNSSVNLLILRNNFVPTLGNVTPTFAAGPFTENGTGGTLYVPSALIDSYKAATNWSTILSYENNQILPIEGSIYETQYADGTPIT